MKKVLTLITLVFAIGLFSTLEPAFSAQKSKQHNTSKQDKKTTKVSSNKKSKSSKSKTIRVRHANNINNPSDGENLKLESIAKDLLSNEQ